MLYTHADLAGESGGVDLSSSLDRGQEYTERTRRLGQERMLACRAVLILTEVLLLLMPLSEYFCQWDRFLRGGPDVEFGVLSLLLFAGLVLLTAYREVTSPFLVLLAYRLIALPLRRLSTSRHLPLTLSWFQAVYRPGTPPLALPSLAGIPLRI
jgi:hypothetical protein